MQQVLRFKRSILMALALTTFVTLSSCGTLLYKERRNQSAGGIGDLDPTVVLLDAVGLLLFLIPGIVAFAVDFSNNTIYVPPDKRDSGDMSEWKARSIYAGTRELDAATIERVVEEQTGIKVRLDDPRVIRFASR